MNIYPYVYRVDHPSGEFYIGYRHANTVPAEQDLGHKYKTSSKYLSYPFEEYSLTVVAEFFTDTAKTDALDFEQALIFEHWGNTSMVNKVCRHNSKVRFIHLGVSPLKGRKRVTEVSDETRAKISASLTGEKHRSPRSEEHKKKISLLKTGKSRGPVSKETREKISASMIKYKNGAA